MKLALSSWLRFALLCTLCMLTCASFAQWGKTVLGTDGISREVGPELNPDPIFYKYQATSFSVTGAHAGDFRIVSADYSMQSGNSAYNSAQATVIFNPSGVGEREATLVMAWTSYNADGSVRRTGSATRSMSGTGVMPDPTPGRPEHGQPEICLNTDNNRKSVDATLNPASGNLRSAAKDPVRTRGYALTFDVYLNTQNPELLGKTNAGNADFTYSLKVGTYTGSTYPSYKNKWLVRDADGTLLDFGPTSAAPKASTGIFSTLTTTASGYLLSNAGAPGDLREYGSYRYEFDLEGKLLTVRDPAGNIQQLTYSGTKLIRVDDLSSKKFLNFVYSGTYIKSVFANGTSFKTELTHSNGRLTLVQFFNPDGSVATRTDYYYTSGRLSGIARDLDSNTLLTIVYDLFPTMGSGSGSARANVSNVLYETKLEWGSDASTQGSFQVYSTDSKNNKTTYTVSKEGLVLSLKPPLYNGSTSDTTLRYTYNSQRQLASVRGPGVNRTYSYNSKGKLIAETDGTGLVRRYEYSGPNLRRILDNAGTIGEIQYTDARFPNLPTKYLDGLNRAWTRTLNAHGQTLTVQPPSGSATGELSLTYDEVATSPTYGWVKSSNQDGVVRQYGEYNDMGDSEFAQTAAGPNVNLQRRLTLDGAQRPKTLTHGDGASANWAYSGRKLATYTDEAGFATSFDWCPPCGKLLGVRRAMNWQNRIGLDADRHVVRFTDSMGRISYLDRGKNGELIQLRFPDGTKTRYQYNNGGQLRAKTNNRAQVTNFTYDPAGRAAQRTGPGIAHSFTYNLDGSMKQASATDVRYDYTYDASRRLTKIVITFLGAGAPAAQTLTYDYLPDGRTASVKWAHGAQTAMQWFYAYGVGGALTMVRNGGGDRADYGYDSAARLKSIARSNQTNTAFGLYEPRGWVTSIRHAYGGTPFRNYALRYDGGQNRVRLLDRVAENNGDVTTFGFDALRRLTNAKRVGTHAYDHTYGYSLNANVLSVNGTPFAGYDAANKITSTTAGAVNHDLDGNLTQLGASSFSWNADDKLTTWTSGGATETNAYDAFGRRVSSDETGVGKTFYIFDSSRLIGEIRGGQILAAYTWGAEGLTAQTSWPGGTRQTLWYHFGAQGETRAMTNASGSVVWTGLYDPYGRTIRTTGTVRNPFGYGGSVGYYTTSGNRILCTQRWYSPILRRWISRDPIGYEGGENLYAYVGGDPVNTLDPLGLEDAKGIGSVLTDRYEECKKSSFAALDPSICEVGGMGFTNPDKRDKIVEVVKSGVAVAQPYPRMTPSSFIKKICKLLGFWGDVQEAQQASPEGLPRTGDKPPY